MRATTALGVEAQTNSQTVVAVDDPKALARERETRKRNHRRPLDDAYHLVVLMVLLPAQGGVGRVEANAQEQTVAALMRTVTALAWETD